MVGNNRLAELQSLFVCEHCGSCCRIGGNVLLSEDDANGIKEHLKHEAPKGTEIQVRVLETEPRTYMFEHTSPCPLFDESNNLCKTHNHKPLCCRHYPFLSIQDGTTCFQDIFVCRGAVRALSKYLDAQVV